MCPFKSPLGSEWYGGINTNPAFDQEASLSAIALELEDLEQNIDQFSLSEDYQQYELDEIGDELDTLFIESGYERTLGADRRPQGAFG